MLVPFTAEAGSANDSSWVLEQHAYTSHLLCTLHAAKKSTPARQPFEIETPWTRQGIGDSATAELSL
jgi:hypothetical protein